MWILLYLVRKQNTKKQRENLQICDSWSNCWIGPVKERVKIFKKKWQKNWHLIVLVDDLLIILKKGLWIDCMIPLIVSHKNIRPCTWFVCNLSLWMSLSIIQSNLGGFFDFLEMYLNLMKIIKPVVLCVLYES